MPDSVSQFFHQSVNVRSGASSKETLFTVQLIVDKFVIDLRGPSICNVTTVKKEGQVLSRSLSSLKIYFTK